MLNFSLTLPILKATYDRATALEKVLHVWVRQKYLRSCDWVASFFAVAVYRAHAAASLPQAAAGVAAGAGVDRRR